MSNAQRIQTGEVSMNNVGKMSKCHNFALYIYQVLISTDPTSIDL